MTRTGLASTVGIVVLVVAQTSGAAVVGATGAAPPLDLDDRSDRPTAALERAVERVVDAADSERIDPLPFGVVAAYSRFDDSDPLTHDLRRALHAAVTGAPGRSLAAVARDVDASTSTVRYHVRVLEREGLIESAKIGGHNRLFPARFGGDAELAAAMEADASRAVVAAVDRLEPVSVTALSAALDRSPSTVSYHHTRLVDAGVLDRERAGREVLLSLADGVRDRLSPDGDRPSRARS